MRKPAFSLIELLIVIFILGLLATIVAYVGLQRPKQARDAQRKSDLGHIKRALEEARVLEGGYPACPSNSTNCYIESAVNTINPTLSPEYLKTVPQDPINEYMDSPTNNYKYNYSPLPSECTGKDGANPCTSYAIGVCLESTADKYTANADFRLMNFGICSSSRRYYLVLSTN